MLLIGGGQGVGLLKRCSGHRAKCGIAGCRRFETRSAPQAHAVIAPRRSSSAHLHRPWRATSEYGIAAKCRRFPDAPSSSDCNDRARIKFSVTVIPSRVMMRQIAGAFHQYEKARPVAKLKAARDRKRAAGMKVEGRRSNVEIDAAKNGGQMFALARSFGARRPREGADRCEP